MFVQILINSLVAGSIYALIASGFSIIYTTNKFVHFAHGSTATIAAYLFYWQLTRFNFPVALAVVLTIIASGLIGFLYFGLI
jgi:branched-chain amino acid transport system permease protein